MKEYQSLSHTRWDCKYPVVFIPKRRKKRCSGCSSPCTCVTPSKEEKGSVLREEEKGSVLREGVSSRVVTLGKIGYVGGHGETASN